MKRSWLRIAHKKCDFADGQHAARQRQASNHAVGLHGSRFEVRDFGPQTAILLKERIDRGEATPMDLDIMASVQEQIMGHCLCVLGDSMAMPIGSMIKHFREEFETVIAAGQTEAPTEAVPA